MRYPECIVVPLPRQFTNPHHPCAPNSTARRLRRLAGPLPLPPPLCPDLLRSGGPAADWRARCPCPDRLHSAGRRAPGQSDADWAVAFQKPATPPTSVEPSTTGLSAHLKFGCLSPRTFLAGLRDAASRAGPKITRSQPPVSLEGQLLWREFFYFNRCSPAASLPPGLTRGAPRLAGPGDRQSTSSNYTSACWRGGP